MLNFITYKEPTIFEIEEYRNKITPKVTALLDMVDGVQPEYKSFNEGSKKDIENYKSFIETNIGAALWYINKSTKLLWSGKISAKALYELKDNPNSKLSEEHFYPRKISAREVLKTDWSNFDDAKEEFINRFLNKYGRFHYVTKNENKIVAQYQKVGNFRNPEDSYQKAGIKLIDWIYAKEELFDENYPQKNYE